MRYYSKKHIEEAIEKLIKMPYYQHNDESWYSGVSAVADELIGIPTFKLPIDATGHWIKSKYDLAKCSWCCQEHAYPPTWNFSDCKKYWLYCPSCGARMVEEIE